MPTDFLAEDMQISQQPGQPRGRDFLMEEFKPKESFGTSAALAIPRVGTDIAKGAYKFAQEIPGYYEKSKTEIPGALNVLKQTPGRAGSQALAGLSELGQSTFNLPHNLVNYLSQRLNLVPEDINKMVQMGRMPSDTQQLINQQFGNPEQPGENLIRGIPRNALSILGGGQAASILNPTRLTHGNIAKEIVNAEKQQVKAHNKLYNNVWKEADKSGFNNVPFDQNILKPNIDLITKYYPEKSTKMMDAFMKNPTLENAQKAQSDLGNLRRSLEEKSRTTPLLETEKNLHDALSRAEQHIEGNMFKNKSGQVNQGLKNQYDKVTNSYRENVVPYKYNSDIQAYKNKELLPKELVNRLSRGEFAAKKGSSHRAIGIRNMLGPAATGAGILGGTTWLYNQMFGDQTRK